MTQLEIWNLAQQPWCQLLLRGLRDLRTRFENLFQRALELRGAPS